MKRRRSSSVTMTGSISTPFRIRRTSSNATMLFGLVIASVSRLLQKAIGTALCSLTSDAGSSERTRGSILHTREVDEVDAGVLVRAVETLGEGGRHAERDAGMLAHDALEVVARQHRAGRRLERDDRGGARLLREQRHLAEHLPRAELGEQKLHARVRDPCA